MAKRRSFFTCMVDTKNALYLKKDREGAKSFLLLNDFVLKGSYSSLRKAPYYAKMFLEGYSEHQIASQFNITEVRVRGIKKQLSDELYELFGEDVFELLESYEKKQSRDMLADRIFFATNWDTAMLELVNPFVVQQLHGVSTSGNDTYSLEDCLLEISFLKGHSKKRIQEEMSILDEGKLNYIIGILSGSDCSLVDKKDLLNILKNT